MEQERIANLKGAFQIYDKELKEAHEKHLLDSNVVIRFECREGYNRTFDHIVTDYEKAIDSDVTYLVDTITTVSNKVYIRVSNKKYLRDFWISTSKFDVKFDRNSASQMDIAPTILDFLNLEIPEKMDGRSLLK